MHKSERLLNLLILLKVQRGFVSKHRIRSAVPDYTRLSDDAFERMFDRDKEALRELGVPIEVGSLDDWFDDDFGYRVRPDEFELPAITLTADEAAVVALAATAWKHSGMAGAARGGLTKLVAAGVQVDRDLHDTDVAILAADEPAFDALWRSVLDHTPVSFEHRSGGAVTRRVVEPWGMVSSSGRWYLVGRDRDRGAERLFRLSRIVGKVTRRGRSGAFEVPASVDLRAILRRLQAPRDRRVDATVLVRQDSALALRRAAARVEEEVTGPDRLSGWDRLHLTDWSPDMVEDEVLALGTDAVVETPTSARAGVVRRVAAALAAR